MKKYTDKELTFICSLCLHVSGEVALSDYGQVEGTLGFAAGFAIINRKLVKSGTIECPEYDKLRDSKLMKLINI